MTKMTFDTRNSRCQTAGAEEHTHPECGDLRALTPAELRQLRRLQTERCPEACLGCGLEHSCSTHGCAVLRKALRVLGGEVHERT